MITPQFDVDQDNDFVYVNIRAPYIKASMIQFEVSDELFIFSLPPYYLRLRLPGNMIEDDRMSSKYDLKSATIQCKVAKQTPGEHFEDLDMITKLLATKSQQQQQQKPVSKPLIQEVDVNPESISHPQDIDLDWEIEQELPREVINNSMYGFNNQYTGLIGVSLHNGNDINELAEPETETVEERIELMRLTTTDSFDLEHYWADRYDDAMIKELLQFKFPTNLELTGDLKDRVMRLGHREYLLSHPKQIYLGLVPLMFAWAYDYRTNLGDFTVESAWNVGKLVPGMCFLYNSYTAIDRAVIDCTARSVSKPLYRNWELTLQVWKDTVSIFKGGKRALLVAFAHLLQIFESDLYLVYRQILIEDYTVWVQFSSDSVISSLSNELERAISTLNTSKIYLPLEAVPADESDEGDSDDEE